MHIYCSLPPTFANVPLQSYSLQSTAQFPTLSPNISLSNPNFNMADSLWKYTPSVVPAIVFTSIYAATAIVHLYQSIHYRALYCIPIIIGATWECGGYAVRVYANHNTTSVTVYATQSILIVLAPACTSCNFPVRPKLICTYYKPVIAAFDYAVFGRILRSCLPGEKVLRIPPHLVTRIFVTCDVITFLVQSTGGGMLSSGASDPSRVNLGNHILTIGLILQVITFGFFTAASIRFVQKLKHQKTLPAEVLYSPRKRRALMFCLWASCFCIILRKRSLYCVVLMICMSANAKFWYLGSIYRIVEFSQGYNGYLISHEIYLYIFEAVPMVPPLVLFNIWHPGKVDKVVGTDVEMST